MAGRFEYTPPPPPSPSASGGSSSSSSESSEEDSDQENERSINVSPPRPSSNGSSDDAKDVKSTASGSGDEASPFVRQAARTPTGGPPSPVAAATAEAAAGAAEPGANAIRLSTASPSPLASQPTTPSPSRKRGRTPSKHESEEAVAQPRPPPPTPSKPAAETAPVQEAELDREGPLPTGARGGQNGVTSARTEAEGAGRPSSPAPQLRASNPLASIPAAIEGDDLSAEPSCGTPPSPASRPCSAGTPAAEVAATVAAVAVSAPALGPKASSPWSRQEAVVTTSRQSSSAAGQSGQPRMAEGAREGQLLRPTTPRTPEPKSTEQAPTAGAAATAGSAKRPKRGAEVIPENSLPLRKRGRAKSSTTPPSSPAPAGAEEAHQTSASDTSSSTTSSASASSSASSSNGDNGSSNVGIRASASAGSTRKQAAVSTPPHTGGAEQSAALQTPPLPLERGPRDPPPSVSPVAALPNTFVNACVLCLKRIGMSNIHFCVPGQASASPDCVCLGGEGLERERFFKLSETHDVRLGGFGARLPL